jgi:predicted phage tail protein
MEPRFGRDFSQVRVQTDAQAVNALAFTIGQDIVFGAGQYAPGTA